ncbi:MAG: Flp pilus assembly protein CpaB [Alphaproteobacteria bacterium]|nr:Flp pilus assembly protein CpaB [Alphaproteobacteria bacterium]
MNKSVLMVMGGAMIVAITVALIVQSKLSPKGGAPAPKTVEILVANKPILVGDTLKAADVRWQSWPESGAFKGVIRKTAEKPDIDKLDVLKSPVRRAIESGEPITRQALVPDVRVGNNFLSARISPGMRAVAISVKASTMAGGFMAPGDHVDVILSYTPNLPNVEDEVSDQVVRRFASQTILSNVKVLAVDQNAKDEDRPAKIAKTVTLEVTQEGAQIIALTDRMGELSLALRRIGEKDTPVSVAVPLTTDATTSAVVKRINELNRKTKNAGGTIRMYSGSQVINVPVRVDAESAGE